MPAVQTPQTTIDSESGTDTPDIELGDSSTASASSSPPNSLPPTPQLNPQLEQQQTLLPHPHTLTTLKSHPTGKPTTDPPGPLPFLCFDLSRLSPTTRFILLTIGVSVFFLLNSWVEEYTFKQLPSFRFGWYLTFFELICFTVFAMVERIVIHYDEPVLSHTAPLSRHGIVAAAMTVSRGLTNVSLQFLNYPTQIIFKSMKLITVMIGSLFILNSQFSMYEYVSAIALVIAAIFFSLGDTDVSVEFPIKGITIVLLSLIGDSLHSNTQDSLLRHYNASTSEAMLFTNLFAALASLVYIAITGELLAAIAYCQLYPMAYVLFVVRSSVIYMGVLCFMAMIKSFGVVAATSVTTVRKIVSILLSFVLFPKAWSSKYMWGGVMFGASLLLSVMDQRYKRAKAVEEKRNKVYT